MDRIIIDDVEDDLPLLQWKPIASSDRFRLLTKREAVWFDITDKAFTYALSD